MVHLEGRVAAPTTDAADGAVSLLDLVESLLADSIPAIQSGRRHVGNVHKVDAVDLLVAIVGEDPIRAREPPLRPRFDDLDEPMWHGCGSVGAKGPIALVFR